MSAKTTGVIWDLELPVPKRMVLLAMVDHADHAGAHIHAPIAFIAWKTGYSARNVTRIIQELMSDELLILTNTDLGIANEYQFDFSHAKMKPPYRGRKPIARRRTPDILSPPTPDKMSGVATKTGRTPDKMSGGDDILSPPTPDKMAIDYDNTLLDHESITTTTSTNPIAHGGGGEDRSNGKPNKTELYHWLRANGVKSADAALRNQHHDLAATQAFYRSVVGDSVGDEREKRIGRFMKSLSADGPPPIPPSPANGRRPAIEPIARLDDGVSTTKLNAAAQEFREQQRRQR